jgi:pimeloyl-ACP methyl ester carboxylesterase
MITNDGGQRLLPRLVRYIEERRRDEARFTGAIERHPSPLTVVWGRDDPIAVAAMASRLARARPDLRLQLLDGVGHYPMVEAPDRFLDALAAGGFGDAPLAGGSGGAEDLAVDGDEPPVR